MGKRSALKRARNEEKREHRAHATVKYVRISSRKVRIVINLIRGKKVDEALAILRFTPKSASPVVEKLLNSAIANAEHNMGLSRDTLYVAEIFANQGPSLKRFMPRAKGSASGAICGLTRRSAQGRFTRCNLAALNSRKGSTRERRKSSKKSTKSKLICSARSTRRKLPQKRKRHGRRRKLPGSQRKKPHNNI